MAVGDLTNLERLKQWLGITSDDSDVLLQRLITSASKFVMNELGRKTLAVMDYSDVYDGGGNNFMLLRQWPVLSVASIQFMGVNITQPATGNPRTNGYLLESADSIGSGQQQLTLFGYCFPRGRQLVTVNYRAGFQEVDEPHVITESGDPVAVDPIETTYVWLADIEVNDDAGATMLRSMTSPPGPGEYFVMPDGRYLFNAAQVGDTVYITYSAVPADLTQCANELIGGTWVSKDRIGIKSKTLGGQETIVYDTSMLTASIKELMQPYKRVTMA